MGEQKAVDIPAEVTPHAQDSAVNTETGWDFGENSHFNLPEMTPHFGEGGTEVQGNTKVEGSGKGVRNEGIVQARDKKVSETKIKK